MAKSRILKKDNKAYLELPQEMMEYDEAEVFQLKEGYLVVPVAVKVKEAELAVIRKLLDMKFESRTPSVIEKEFTEVERILLKELERKGLVNLFRGKKYPKGIYNINADVYALLQEPKKSEEPEGLEKGFMTLKDKNEAYRLSQRFNAEMKNGSHDGRQLRGDFVGRQGVEVGFSHRSEVALSEVENQFPGHDPVVVVVAGVAFRIQIISGELDPHVLVQHLGPADAVNVLLGWNLPGHEPRAFLEREVARAGEQLTILEVPLVAGGGDIAVQIHVLAKQRGLGQRREVELQERAVPLLIENLV